MKRGEVKAVTLLRIVYEESRRVDRIHGDLALLPRAISDKLYERIRAYLKQSLPDKEIVEILEKASMI